MAQDSTCTDLTSWKPVPTLLPAEWQTYLEKHTYKTKNSTNYVASMHYDTQEVVSLLRQWGLPWMVVVAGALLFYGEKETPHHRD